MKVYAIVSGYYPEKIHHLYDPIYTTKEDAIKMLHEICDALNFKNEKCTTNDSNFDKCFVDEEKMYVYHITQIETGWNGTTRTFETKVIPCAWVETRELL